MADRPVRLSRVLAAFVRRSLLEGASARAAQALSLFGFAAGAASSLFLARLVDASANPLLIHRGGYTGFLLLGIIGADLQRTAAAALPTRIRDAQVIGTLEATLAAPAPTWMILVGVSLPDLLGSLVRAGAYAIIAAVFVPGLLDRVNVVATLASCALALIAFGPLGLLGAAFTLRLRRGNPLGPLLGGLSLIAGDVLYPTAVLPTWLRPLALILPVSPALSALRAAALDGAGLAEVAPALLRLALFALLVGPPAALLFARALARARADGSLASY